MNSPAGSNAQANHNAVRRVLLPPQSNGPTVPPDVLWHRGSWQSRWLAAPAPAAAPPGASYVAAFRLRLPLAAPASVRIHVSGDERYRLFVDGAAVHNGPERGHADAWRFATFDLQLIPGAHWLALRLWVAGDRAPMNQLSVCPGIILHAEDPWFDRLSTGVAPWECRLLDAYSFEEQPCAFFTGPRTVLDAALLPRDWETGGGDGFTPAAPKRNGHTRASLTDRFPPVLVPERLPPQVCDPLPNGTVALVDAVADRAAATPPCDPANDLRGDHAAWQAFLDGRAPLTLPSGALRRCLVDLGVYRACWPRLPAAGAGGNVRLRFAEALFVVTDFNPHGGNDKGDRREWRGKFLRGVGPRFLTASGPARALDTVDWDCGRWLEIVAAAGSEPLRLERLELQATGYPFSDEGAFASDDARLARIRDLCLHTMRVGTHETYLDCPYYERLQYVGDTRLEALTTYVLQADDRLPRQAIDAFAGCRAASGLVPSRAPARGVQLIPPFALWWIHMVHDHAFWRDDAAFVRAQLSTARSVLDAWWGWRNADGLIEAPVGWNFVDWVPDWNYRCGMPVGADTGVSAILNWHCAWTLRIAAELEESFGEPILAGLHRQRAAALVAALAPSWDATRGRWRDAPGADAVSEHGQILPLLSGLCDGDRAGRTAQSLTADPDLARTTIYFTHYLFEAYRQLGRGDLLARRLGLWHDLANAGLTTTPETPEPTRSDCHPWGAHPLFHFAATVAGLRPAAPGFSRAEVQPLPRFGLQRLAAGVPHPRGRLTVDLVRHGSCWLGHLETPVPADTPAGLAPAGRHAVEWPA